MERTNSKISGYLEKKGKRKMIGCYKKYWFVLEGGLLLYYRSKADYETISPCKGSINLGPPCNIKPCASTAGVFQIQTRTAAVTLRAENREEQNRWMQALMSEINPNTNQQRMSHFRYSMDDLKEPTDNEKQTSQNNEPSERSPLKEDENQNDQMSTDVIIQRLQKLGAQSCIPHGNVAKLTHANKTIPPEIPEKGSENSPSDTEYTELRMSSKGEIQNVNRSSDHIYARITAEFIDNDIYSVPDKIVHTEKFEKSMTLPNKSQGNAYSSLRMKSFGSTKRPVTFILENDTYSVSIQQKAKEDNDGSLLIENDQYHACPHKDQNENEVTPENGYAEISDINSKTTSDVIYENPIYAEPLFEDHQSNKVDKSKDKAEKKLVKRPSFLRRVWKRKEKHKKKEVEVVNCDEVDEIYESVPSAVVEKLTVVNDDTAVQVLTELQNILENKMPFIINHISKNDVGSPTCSTKSETSFDDKTESNIDNDLYCDIRDLRVPILLSQIDSPPVPPKSRKSETPYPFHDIPASPRPIVLPIKKRRVSDDFKSIDEILQDLEEEPHSGKNNKVKRLIKRFSSDQDTDHNVVELRGQRSSHVYREDIGSDELSRLLEELAKVATAPILKPGVTTSLDVSNLEDSELKKLLPGRRRRFSEPDYDVPRPHKSLTILPKTESTLESIGSTRFFGPILKPSDMVAIRKNGDSSEDPSRLNSMTPDSLEASPIPPLETEKIRQDSDDELNCSHMYYKFTDLISFNKSRSSDKYPKILQEPRKTSFMVENDIYDEVRCSHKADSIYESINEVKGNGHENEEYADSLEICKNEVSTGF